jgi:ubiquinone biosynthesis protein
MVQTPSRGFDRGAVHPSGTAEPAYRRLRPRTDDLLLDIRRSLLAFGKILKLGIFPFAGHLPIPFFRRNSFAVRFRRCLEELGLTYLKLGQFLALRFDILPPDVCRELNSLFENIPPMSCERARSIIETELGGSIDRIFASFSVEPIAAASVAQVHDATMVTGQRVAVKVQRPGLDRIFKADIRNLQRLAAIGQSLGVFGQLSARGMVEQFANWTLRELDFRIEGQTSEQVARDAGADVVIPKIHWSLTTQRVLTMDFVEGVSAANLRTFLEHSDAEHVHERLPGFDQATAMHNFVFASLSQLFVTGFFHGDPHPGNIFFLPNNQVAFIDFGIFGALTDVEREIVTGQIENLAVGNLAASYRYYARQVVATPDTDMDRFRADVMDVLRRWYRALLESDSPIEERHLARYTGEMINVSRRNGLIYDLNYLLFWRALNNLNATLWHVDPDYDLIRELKAFFMEVRPDPLERTFAAMRRPSWRQAVADLAFRFPRAAEAGLAEASLGTQAGTRWYIAVSHHSRKEREAAVEAGWSTALLLTLAAVILLTAVPLKWPLQATLVGLVGAFAFLTRPRRK